MRLPTALLLAAALSPDLAHAQANFISPGYPMPYRGNGYASPYPPVLPGIAGVSPFTDGVAAGAYPPGARTCVAAEQFCPASAPNTVGNPCSCPDRDGRPTPGIVR